MDQLDGPTREDPRLPIGCCVRKKQFGMEAPLCSQRTAQHMLRRKPRDAEKKITRRRCLGREATFFVKEVIVSSDALEGAQVRLSVIDEETFTCSMNSRRPLEHSL